MKKESISFRRLIIMAFGIVLMGLGVSLFKFSLMGNDPSNAMAMAIAEKMGISFAAMLYIINSLWFILELSFGRKHIGVGTIANWFGVGIISTGFTNYLNKAACSIALNFEFRIAVMIFGVLVLSFACSLYQTADVGVSPYDSLAIILHERFPRIPYFEFRIALDFLCTVVTFFSGGLVGVGTLTCALGLGPFIDFFDIHVSRKICGVNLVKYRDKNSAHHTTAAVQH